MATVEQYGVFELCDVIRRKARIDKRRSALGIEDPYIQPTDAGIQTECPSHELSAAEFDRVLDINLRGAFLCARETIKHLLAQQPQ